MPRSILKPHLKPNHDSLDSMWKMQHDSQSSMATPMRQPLGRFEGVTGNVSWFTKNISILLIYTYMYIYVLSIDNLFVTFLTFPSYLSESYSHQMHTTRSGNGGTSDRTSGGSCHATRVVLVRLFCASSLPTTVRCRCFDLTICVFLSAKSTESLNFWSMRPSRLQDHAMTEMYRWCCNVFLTLLQGSRCSIVVSTSL